MESVSGSLGLAGVGHRHTVNLPVGFSIANATKVCHPHGSRTNYTDLGLVVRLLTTSQETEQTVTGALR